MKNNIKFSIIMPFYNSAAYIENAVKSVFNQTYQNFEFIAVNDGSNDNSADIVKELFKDHKEQLVLLEKENGGYVSAVNYGLDHVSGTYFLFMGSDDRLDENLLSTIASNLDEELPDLIGFNTMKVKDGVEKLEKYNEIKNKVCLQNTNICEFSIKFPIDSRIFSMRDTSKCYKASLLGELRYFGKYGYDADGIFTMLFARKCTSFMCLPVIGYYWTLHGDSLSGKKPTDLVNIDRIENWNKFYLSLKVMEGEYSCFEIEYLKYFKSIVINCAEQSKLLLKHNKVVFRTARSIILSLNKRYKFLGKKNKLFFRMPHVYMFLKKIR